MAEEKRYIYCVIPINEERKFDLVGLEKEEIYTINYKDIAAAVSDISLSFEECDPTRRNIKAHTLVLETLMKDYTILPARFGLISDSDDKIKGLLQKYYSTLKDYIKKLNNRMEVGVKVFWNKDAMMAELMAKNEKIAKLKEEIKTLPPPIARQKLVKAGQMVESLGKKWETKYTDRVYLELMKVAVDHKR
ncbi:MAG: GvpL/GvpF family gas vesicle protein, partial [Candidatus Aerophobetes bacterium]|nr:GvpL/GvpF family gas vesicle protein [Candidatus Aerophobetes bacterium]